MENLGNSATLRGVTLAVLVLGVQTSTLARMRPGGSIIDIVAMLAVAAGIVAGPQRGARAGFMLGLAFDSQLQSPFGIKALTYGLAAFAAGMLPTEPLNNVRWVRAGAMAVAGAVVALGEMVIAAVFGQDQAVTLRGALGIPIGAIVGLLLGPLAIRVMRWTLMAGDHDRH